MNLKEFFAKVVVVLKKEKVRFALAGGLVASLYRQEERLTKDLDFLILAESHTEQKAIHIIRSLGLNPSVIRRADLEGGPPWMVAGRKEAAIGLDFILPEMPWFQSALMRAEQNLIDFGFGKPESGKVACLSIEDVIVAKFFALKNDSTRFNDLDDLKSIFLGKHPLDLDYLSGQMQRLGLVVPEPIQKIVPKALNIVFKKKKE